MGPDRIRPHRNVIKVDIGTMKDTDVKNYVKNLTTKWRYNISSDEYAIDLRKYSKTTQILIRSKWETQSKSWLGDESKLFFRLWRFIYRDFQRKNGFEKDIQEYDKFVRTWKLNRLEGDYVIVKPNDDLVKSKSEIIQERERERLRAMDDYNQPVYRTQAGPPPSPSHSRKVTDLRRSAINKFRGLVRSDTEILNYYRGVCIRDEKTMQGLYNILLIYEFVLSKSQFNDRWHTLGIINGTGTNPLVYWGSDYKQFQNSIIDNHTPTMYPNLNPTSSSYCHIETLTTTRFSDGKTVKWSFSRELWESFIRDYTFMSTDTKRKDFNPFEEYMFRYVHYYPLQGILPVYTDVMDLPKCPSTPSLNTKRDQVMNELRKKHLMTIEGLPEKMLASLK